VLPAGCRARWRQLVVENELGIIEQSADQRRLAVIDRAAGQEARRLFCATARPPRPGPRIERRVHRNSLALPDLRLVDDGKSTLIGRLLYDSKLIFDDQLSAIERDSRRHGNARRRDDLALLVDGLEAEREQGITIDVAYRYFTTPRRAFIVAIRRATSSIPATWRPVHPRRNLAVVLVDARKGVLTQTRRHSYICSLLGIRSIVLAVNKIDWWSSRGTSSSALLRTISACKVARLQPGYRDPVVGALRRECRRKCRSAMPWYDGPPLLDHLETVDVAQNRRASPRCAFRSSGSIARTSIFRGFTGTVASGGSRSRTSGGGPPPARDSRVERIVTFDGDRDSAEAGDAVTLTLADEVDIARGDVLVRRRTGRRSRTSLPPTCCG